MLTREIGSSGVQASAIALGTWAIGGGGFWDKQDDDAAARKTIEQAIEGGITLIDTAPGYGEGKSERIIGDVIKGYDRKKLVLSTKCGIIWWGNEGGYMHTLDGKDYFRNLEPHSMKKELGDSLERLGTDYIDVFFTHWQSLPSFPTPIGRTMEGLMRFKEEGLIKAIGVSNASLEDIKDYMRYGKVDVTQPAYSMLTRDIEGEYLDYCIVNNISVFAYSPLEQGLLTGKITMDYEPPAGTYRADYIGWYKKENRKQVLDMLAGWKDLEEKYNASLAQLVIAWTIAQPGITHALCGARKAEHLQDNIGGGNIALESVDLARMRADVEKLKLN